ncbi:MAG: Gfo/Idh/MocA family protein [Phycisphaeraceae bacterium]
MVDNPVRAVIVGCGGMSRRWIQTALESPEIELAGLVDLQRASAEQRARDFELDAALVYDSLDAALAEAKPEVVFDVTVPAAHHAVTCAALRAGCHVLGEKPMAESMDQAREMVTLARETGRRYSVMQNRRAIPEAVSVAAFLRGGALGPVEEVHCDFFLGPHFSGFRDAMAHPLLLDMAIHTFDNARQMSGADPRAVYCHAFNPQRSWYAGDASAVALFEMAGPDGAPIVYNYRGSWCAEGLATAWAAQWRFVCRKGTLTWDGDQAVAAERVADEAAPGMRRPTEPCAVERVALEQEGHAHIIRQFVRSLRSDEPPLTPCEDNIKSLAMVFAAIDSAAKRQRVEVRW